MKWNLVFAVCIILFSSCRKKEKVDLIIHHAKIYTVNEAFDTAKVIIIHQGKIKAIGGDSLLIQYQSKKTIDAKGKFIYPGFIDAHCHFTAQAMDAYKLKLFGTTSFKEIVDKVIVYAKSNTHSWIEGTGWDQHDWTNKELPSKDTLDKLFPSTPVFLLRVDGHAALLNQKALNISGITTSTKVSGGEVMQKDGKLTGILIDNAVQLARDKMPSMQQNEAIDEIIKAQQDYFQFGLTTVVECGVEKNMIDWMKRAYAANKIKLSTCFMLLANDENFKEYLNKEVFRNERMHIAGFKVFADGALGSRGAFMLDEYDDRHQHFGAMLLPPDSLKQIVARVSNSPYQLCVHAIGDATNRITLQLFSQVLDKKNDRRWRIEHAQVVHPNDVHLFGEYSIIPSVQPTHAIGDMSWVLSRVGEERLKNAYTYQTLLQQNNWMPLGTDYPVESLNPMHTFHAAVFRCDSMGRPAQGFMKENALSRVEALKGITIWAAKSVFEETEKGSLEIGKNADLVIVDTDILNATPLEIFHAKVLQTFILGEQVFKSK